MKYRALYVGLLAGCVACVGLWSVHRARVTAGASRLESWSPQAAANYLDHREVWWQYWPPAQADHGTVCISCHTVVPYAMIRTALGQTLHEAEMPATEKIMMGSVEKRVGNWSEMGPFFSDAAAESRATEAVLNAVILASYDAQRGQLRPITRAALDEAWALQEESGANAGGWNWQDFGLAPWESAESGYQGAALFMLEVENTPGGYSDEHTVQEHLRQVQSYLRTHYASQPLMNQLYVLWLSSKAPELLTPSDRKALLDSLQRAQNSDGGWSLSSLDPAKQLGTAQWKHRLKQKFINIVKSQQSDGYATGLVVVALEESGTNRQDKMLRGGLQWLVRHQGGDGSWQASSLNSLRDPQSDIGRFMSDAATAYAVMALEGAQVSLK